MRAKRLYRLVTAAAVALGTTARAAAAQDSTPTRPPPGFIFSYGVSFGALEVGRWRGTSSGNRFRLMLYPARGVGVGAELRQDGRDFSKPSEVYIVSLTLLGHYHPAAVPHGYAQLSAGRAFDRRNGVDGTAVGIGAGAALPVKWCTRRCLSRLAIESELLTGIPRAASGSRFGQLTLTGLSGFGHRF